MLVLTLPSYREAERLLLRFRMPYRYPQARSLLESRLAGLQLLGLYRHYFPEEYAASHAQPSSKEGWAYSPREVEFLSLVSERLFPLPVDLIVEGMTPEERFWFIPIFSLGIDWWDSRFDEISLGWQLLLLVLGYVGESDGASDLNAGEAGEALWSARTGIDPGELAFDELAEICAVADGPLAGLPMALSIIEHQTDNVWFDYSDEAPYQEAEWCERDIDLLTREYRAAKDMDALADALILWIEADPLAHFQEVIRCWNQAVRLNRSSARR